MAGRQSRAGRSKPGSPRVRSPKADAAATAGRRSEPGWMTTIPVDADAPGSACPADSAGSTDWPAGRERDDRGAPPGHARADRDGDDPERDDPESVARLICLRLLAAAPRTHAELATALRRRGVPEDAAQAVLSRFAEVKLIDDATFARAWVESRHHGRGLAGRALRDELRRKGVGSDDIASALAELDPDRELATARELVARRLPGTRGQPGPARMRRLVGLLARKGYPAGLAYRVVREALEQEPADGEEEAYLDELAEPDGEEGPDGFGRSGEL
jgi:regulatory protein